jgi:hypothetical protein
LLPSPYIISHAPQGPYFTGTQKYRNNGYLAVDAQVGNMIDYYNIQFYNQVSTKYETYETIFVSSDGWATETAVAQMVAHGVPKHKLVVGKGVAQGDVVNTGFIPQSTLKNILARGVQNGYSAGFMGWQLSSDSTNWGGDLASVFAGIANPVPVADTPRPVSRPVPVADAPRPVPLPVPKSNTCGGQACSACCSKWNYCGVTDDHCLPSRGCQAGCRNNGRLDSNQPIPEFNSTETAGSEQQTGVPVWGIALIVVGAVVAAIVIVGFVAYKMTRRNDMERV